MRVATATQDFRLPQALIGSGSRIENVYTTSAPNPPGTEGHVQDNHTSPRGDLKSQDVVGLLRLNRLNPRNKAKALTNNTRKNNEIEMREP